MKSHINNLAISRPASRRRRGYSLLEMLITVLIIQIISGMVMVNTSSVQRTEKLQRTGQQMTVALRYARILAMSSGQPAGVEFDVTNNTFRVFQGTSATTVSNSMFASGSYSVNLNTDHDCGGVKIADASLTNAPTSPFRVTFGTLGGTSNYGSVAINYGGTTLWVSVPQVGEPIVDWKPRVP
jgi:prepilin-type N-terminal cleavage/methylation domain-containing protein